MSIETDLGFETYSAEEIRDSILNFQLALAQEEGYELDVSPGSPEWIQASAVALQAEATQKAAPVMVAAIFGDTADPAQLEEHASRVGLVRKAAIASRLTVSVSGAASTTYPLAGQTLNAADGTKFLPVDAFGAPLASLTTALDGLATISVDCLTPGVIGNKPTSTILTWSSPPVGMNSTGLVVTSTRTGADQETDKSLAQRWLQYMRERPGGGNRAQWVDWAQQLGFVLEAYVYCVTKPGVGAEEPGCVTTVIVGDRTVNNGILSGSDAATVKGYIEGTNDLLGQPVTGGSKQLRFCSLDATDITVMAATPVPVDVEVQVALGSGQAYPFTGSYTVDVGSTSTVINVTTDPSAVGPGQVNFNDYIAILTEATSGVRGRYVLRRVASRNASSITIDTPLAAGEIPIAGAKVFPAPENWDAMRDAVFAVFNRLGPGDTTPTQRYPEIDDQGRPTLYRGALQAVVQGLPGYAIGDTPSRGISGVVSATVVQPATDMTPAPFELYVPGKIWFRV